jgi:hypothetical protein
LKPRILRPAPVGEGKIVGFIETTVDSALQEDELPIAKLDVASAKLCGKIFQAKMSAGHGIMRRGRDQRHTALNIVDYHGLLPDKITSFSSAKIASSIELVRLFQDVRSGTMRLSGEGMRKRIVAHQHVLDSPALALSRAGYLSQKGSDVGIFKFETPQLLRQTIGRTIFFVERLRQRLPAISFGGTTLFDCRESAAPGDDLFADAISIAPSFPCHLTKAFAILGIVHAFRMPLKARDSLCFFDIALAQEFDDVGGCVWSEIENAPQPSRPMIVERHIVSSNLNSLCQWVGRVLGR